MHRPVGPGASKSAVSSASTTESRAETPTPSEGTVSTPALRETEQAVVHALQGRGAIDPRASPLNTQAANRASDAKVASDASVKPHTPVVWSEPQMLRFGLKTSLQPKSDGFTRGISADDAPRVLTGIEKANEWLAHRTETGPVNLVLKLGAANASANGTNPSFGGQASAENVRLQNAVVTDDHPTLVVKVDSHPAGFDEHAHGAVVSINGAYPLIDKATGHDEDVQDAMTALAQRAIASGGQFVLQNFITDNLYPGLMRLLMSANKQSMPPKSQMVATSQVTYLGQYLQNSEKVHLVGFHGRFFTEGSAHDLRRLTTVRDVQSKLHGL